MVVLAACRTHSATQVRVARGKYEISFDMYYRGYGSIPSKVFWDTWNVQL